MDKGAHFYKCDFQVHTPRDINWNGKRPVTESERKIYAEEFVKKCRLIGLNAVAITDHHDFGFFPFIKDAADNELDITGNLLPIEKKLIVFPGIELTFSTPACQAILIIDADYPVNNLNQILHLLAITPTNDSEATTAQTLPISNTIVNGFQELYDKLNTIESIRGKFILLPNLSEGGRHTLLRAGNSEHYKKMPCVGGYVDGSISQHGTGNNNIVNGKTTEWGKGVALFQTSDNRRRDLNSLGGYTTWVKWAVPTAEALRQACLAKESRMTQEVPLLPQVYISKIDVTNSRFLGSFTIDFNQQYNAIIGGRGTGKSTILEYLRWGICDQLPQSFETEDISEIERRRKSLIDKTLIPFDGEVRVTFDLNGVNHIVKKNSKTKETLLKIGDGAFQKVNEDEIRRVLPIQAYSQKQLSSVGVKTEELKRFIQQPIQNQLNNLKFQIEDNAKKTKKTYNNYIRKKEIQYEIDQINIEIKSLNNQAENLRKSLIGISDEDQIIISKKQNYELEQNIINKSKIELSNTSNKISELLNSLKMCPEQFLSTEQLENIELINQVNKVRHNIFEQVKQNAQQLFDLLCTDNLKELNELFNKWYELKENFEAKYEMAKAKASSSQQTLNEIRRIEIRLEELTNVLNERLSGIKELQDSETELTELRNEWYLLHQKKIDLLNEQSINFSILSNGIIKAEINKSIDTRRIKNFLISALSGTRIREDKVQAICEFIKTSENPLESWKLILGEFKQLAETKFSEDKIQLIPKTPSLIKSGFNEGNIIRIIEVLNPENWIQIATTENEFTPEFKYITNNQMGDEILFSEASAGQQATALLTVLLNQSGAPLIIDQPEDDIDNRAIDEIIKSIWKAKTKRQLIFTSHNANLVVNGDAELVICFDYREAEVQTRGIIKAEGAIDSKIVKDEITSVMEGGEKAFRLRKDKYGF